MIIHLARRFFTSLSGAPPTVGSELWVDDHLLPGERALWVRMSNQDRRHSVAVGRRFAAVQPDVSRALIAGALLHDVGKLECQLGTFGRVAATLVGPRGPGEIRRRFRAYHDHEAIGAALAGVAGSDPATVELIAGRGPFSDALDACDR